jgi:DNA-directed RNA polymerase subunit H (RpoH/RPB5)
MATTTQIIELHKSRKIIIEILETQKYDVAQYKDFSINDINTMIQTKQLDMFLKKNNGQAKKIYIKYHLGKSLSATNIYEYIDDLFVLEEILTKADDLLIIMKDEPNESIRKILTNIWEKDGIFITVVNIKQLQYNILSHSLVPPHRVLTPEETVEFKRIYNVTEDSQVPDISRFSPVSKVIGIRPGQICHILRPSKTAISAPFYRVCTNK